MLSRNRLHSHWAGLILLVTTAFMLVAAEPEGQDYQSRKTAREESLKDLEARAKRLAAEGAPKKTPEEREKESKPIIPEDCVIQVGLAYGDKTDTRTYSIIGGKVTATAPEVKSPDRSGDGYRIEGPTWTRRFEGDLRGNVITGAWQEESDEHKSWHYEKDGGLALHTVCKMTRQQKTNIVLHSDLTCTVAWEGIDQKSHLRALVGVLNADTGQKESTDTSSFAGWPPAQGVWQFRSTATVPTKPEEKRAEITTGDMKFQLPKEKPSALEPASRVGRITPPSGEEEFDKELPPSAKRRFDALSAERKSLFTKYHLAYGLGWKRTQKLLQWLSDDKLPVKEVEVRASLLLVTDQRYWQCYKTIVSKAVDNYVDGKLWELAAKATPLAKHVSMVKDLASAPYELAVIASEYEDAADAEAMLDTFVRTWGKSEDEAVDQLFKTKNAIEFWNRSYAQAEKKFKEAQAIAPPAIANRPPSTPSERQAVQDMKDAHQAMTSATRELKDLNLEFKAWDLRVKTIRGDWKKWVVRWAR